MTKFYRDYVWKEGIPYGIDPVEKDAAISYKIPMDPYRKRIAIEKYINGIFTNVIYDSAFLDFRHLKLAEHTAWQKQIVEENSEQIISTIRNQDDRLIFIETYRFENHYCRECQTKSPHGILLSHQKMFYKALNDDFNGVVLFDNNDHPVMRKFYECDENTGEFTLLLKEEWNIHHSTELNESKNRIQK